MEYADGKVKDLQIAYIGGGSRGWAWTFMTDLAMDEELSGTIRLYDIDAEAAKHNEIIGNRLSSREDVVGKWNYTVSDSLQSALTGADFIVISILPGTFDEMAVDVHMPERLGIYQSVGDTAGPGGAMRALRTIPMYVEIAQAIRAYAPKAWVINYTNPMSLCVKTLYYVFPEIKAFGCCHEVFGTQKVLNGILEETMGLKNVKREDIRSMYWVSTISPGSTMLPIRESICSLFTGNIPRSIRKTATKKRIKTGRTLLSSVPIL